MATNATLETVFDCVNQAVIQLTFRWKIYCQLFDSGQDNVALLNATGAEVFGLFQRLSLDDAILALSRLTDPAYSGRNSNDENATIKYLIDSAATSLAQSTNNELNDLLTTLRRHVHNARTHRNKALAHADLQFFLQRDPLHGVLYDDLEAAMKECRNLMTKLGELLFSRRCSYDIVIPFGRSGSDLISLLRKLHA